MKIVIDQTPIGTIDLYARWAPKLFAVLYKRFGQGQFTPTDAWRAVQKYAPTLAQELTDYQWPTMLEITRHSMPECLRHSFFWLERELYACGTVGKHYKLLLKRLDDNDARKRGLDDTLAYCIQRGNRASYEDDETAEVRRHAAYAKQKAAEAKADYKYYESIVQRARRLGIATEDDDPFSDGEENVDRLDTSSEDDNDSLEISAADDDHESANQDVTFDNLFACIGSEYDDPPAEPWELTPAIQKGLKPWRSRRSHGHP